MQKYQGNNISQLNTTNSHPQHHVVSPVNQLQIISPIILKHGARQEVDSQSQVQDEEKISMKYLCEVFIQQVTSKQPCEFQTKELIEKTGIKQRRIYDLMNILQGCGFVRRVSKGRYRWFGFKEGPQPQESEVRSKEVTSLYNLASKVKSLILNSKSQIYFKDICGQILSENDDKKLNPKSIKRRVYQCCKVLKIFGLVEKTQHRFRWISEGYRVKMEEMQRTKQKEKRNEGIHVKKTTKVKKERNEEQEKMELIGKLLKYVWSRADLSEVQRLLQQQYDKRNDGEKMGKLKLFQDLL